MPTCDPTNAPLYTAAECKTEILRIDALIAEISTKPVGVGVPGVGNAHYAGRLGDLRRERNVWTARRDEALRYDRACSTGRCTSSLQGPKQVLE
jgi:hypothetical protein